MQPVITAGIGFLLAVLWFDLMFDIQLRGHPADEVPEPVLASIAAYYRRVTTDARPLNRLIALVMLVTLVASATQVVRAGTDVHLGGAIAVLACALVGIGIALRRTVGNAVRLGSRQDPTATQEALARSIYRDHRLSAALMLTAMVLELAVH